MRGEQPRTDIGTVIIHWVLAAIFLVAMLSGLKFSLSHADAIWSLPLDWLLPTGGLWHLHVAAGFAITATLCAYVLYIRCARLFARIRLDRVRLGGLARRGRPRWGAINVLIYWSLFASLAAVVTTGHLLFLGHGGTIANIHRIASWLLLGIVCVHVAAHAALGGTQQLMRILRPTALSEHRGPVNMAEAFAAYVREQEHELTDEVPAPARDEPKRRHDAMHLRAHPLAVALAGGLTSLGLLASLDTASRDKLVVERIERDAAPWLDGDLSDPAWRRARPTVIHTFGGSGFAGTGTSRVEVRAIHDGTTAYLAIVWEDPTRSLKHLPLIKRPDGWRLLNNGYDVEDETAYYEDKLAVMLSRSAELGGGGAMHHGARPLSGKPGPLAGRGLHYTTDGTIVDVWHWKAARGGLLGHMDDNYFGPPLDPTQAELSGRSRYKAGYRTDPGIASYGLNFKTEPPGGYRGPLLPLRLPKSLPVLKAALGGQSRQVDLDPEQGEPEGARWWMTPEDSVPYTAGADAEIPVGTVIPGVLIDKTYAGDRAHLRVAARWSAGRWTLEIARLLDTGSRFDLPIESGIHMWVAAFDHAQIRHTRHMRPVTLEVKQ